MCSLVGDRNDTWPVKIPPIFPTSAFVVNRQARGYLNN